MTRAVLGWGPVGLEVASASLVVPTPAVGSLTGSGVVCDWSDLGYRFTFLWSAGRDSRWVWPAFAVTVPSASPDARSHGSLCKFRCPRYGYKAPSARWAVTPLPLPEKVESSLRCAT